MKTFKRKSGDNANYCFGVHMSFQECMDEIKKMRKDVDDIRASTASVAELRQDFNKLEKALVGDDYQGGLIKRVCNVEEKLRQRWGFKDVGTLILGLAALVTAIGAICAGL